MESVRPIFAVELYGQLHEELIQLLKDLTPEDWFKPTIASGWTVKDMAAHLLDTDIRRLSSQRDGLPSLQPERPLSGYRDLVDWINQLNENWVAAARRISPVLLIEFISLTGPHVYQFFRSLDPFAPAGAAVAWAGDRVSPNWFDIAREYTEKWMHQQHIRDATGKPPLVGRKWLHPVLDTFLRGLPHTFQAVDAPEGTAVNITITGEAGGEWSLVKRQTWQLFTGLSDNSQAGLQVGDDTAWRVFTKGLLPQEARQRSLITGDQVLGEVVFNLVALMA